MIFVANWTDTVIFYFSKHEQCKIAENKVCYKNRKNYYFIKVKI